MYPIAADAVAAAAVSPRASAIDQSEWGLESGSGSNWLVHDDVLTVQGTASARAHGAPASVARAAHKEPGGRERATRPGGARFF